MRCEKFPPLISAAVVTFLSLTVLACGRPAGFGIGGRYLDAKQEIVNPRTGDHAKAVRLLESVAREDPLYKDTLTLLGRSYYREQRYAAAFEVLQRAVALNDKDGMAWVALGLTQMRLGQDAQGLDSLKGGLTLLSQVSKDGYKGIDAWDKRGLVRGALRRAAFEVTKGPENKDRILESSEVALVRIDQEERLGKIEQQEEQRANY